MVMPGPLNSNSSSSEWLAKKPLYTPANKHVLLHRFPPRHTSFLEIRALFTCQMIGWWHLPSSPCRKRLGCMHVLASSIAIDKL